MGLKEFGHHRREFDGLDRRPRARPGSTRGLNRQRGAGRIVAPRIGLRDAHNPGLWGHSFNHLRARTERLCQPGHVPNRSGKQTGRVERPRERLEAVDGELPKRGFEPHYAAIRRRTNRRPSRLRTDSPRQQAGCDRRGRPRRGATGRTIPRSRIPRRRWM